MQAKARQVHLLTELISAEKQKLRYEQTGELTPFYNYIVVPSTPLKLYLTLLGPSQGRAARTRSDRVLEHDAEGGHKG